MKSEQQLEREAAFKLELDALMKKYDARFIVYDDPRAHDPGTPTLEVCGDAKWEEDGSLAYSLMDFEIEYDRY